MLADLGKKSYIVFYVGWNKIWKIKHKNHWIEGPYLTPGIFKWGSFDQPLKTSYQIDSQYQLGKDSFTNSFNLFLLYIHITLIFQKSRNVEFGFVKYFQFSWALLFELW